MKEKMIIPVSQEWVNKIQALQYEVTARKDIISYMLANNHSTTSDNYQHYYTEYMDFFKQFEEAKSEFEAEYVLPYTNGVKTDWNLDFRDKEVTFYK